jgi:phosphate-selective porin OprO/OprP
VRPFKKRSAAVDLGLGVAGSYGRNDGALASYKTTGQQSLVSYVSSADATKNATAEKNRRRIAPQGYAYYRSVGLMGEWSRSWQDAFKGATHATLTNTAWNIAGSVVLTGDKSSYGGVKPRRTFDPGAHAFGALGLADAVKSPHKARELGLGINWYLSENLKYQLNLEHTTFEGGAAAGGNRLAENVFLFRGQISF